jgi:membrane fusion protein (multidrug efflux system)
LAIKVACIKYLETYEQLKTQQKSVELANQNYAVVGNRYKDEYQTVHKGDTLAVIGDTEFRLRVAQAEADYQKALTGKTAMGVTISTTHNNLSVSDAGIEEMDILLQTTFSKQSKRNVWRASFIRHPYISF